MRNHARTAATLLTATAVGFGGYAIGTQGDGSAVARDAASRAVASGGDDGRRGPAGDLSALARHLDVSESRLRTALEELHEEGRGDRPDHDERRDEFTRELARELGVSQSRLENALGELRPGPGARGREGGRRPGSGDLAARLAESLDLERSKVDAALRTVREAHEKEHEKRRAEEAAALARKLGISREKVEEAFAAVRPGGRGHHGPGHGRP